MDGVLILIFIIIGLMLYNQYIQHCDILKLKEQIAELKTPDNI